MHTRYIVIVLRLVRKFVTSIEAEPSIFTKARGFDQIVLHCATKVATKHTATVRCIVIVMIAVIKVSTALLIKLVKHG